ncbi:MAG: nucleotidyltransferase family protein [Gammaproteobacteria bacterium]|nr:nucleotidyltransferase family protein [Gammaproteobacteria bacterium]
MKAMILAAGRGERMRPLTDHIPKPLLPIAGKPLIEYQIENLVSAGITDIVINTSYLAKKIHEELGDGSQYGVCIEYSNEGEPALETAGGIKKALPLLGKQAFIVINGDVYCDYPLQTLQLKNDYEAHIILVENPDHNSNGDFSKQGDLLANTGDPMHTFSGIGLYTPQFFSSIANNKAAPLGPLLREKVAQKTVSAEVYDGLWLDIGNVDRLQQLQQLLG